MRPWTTVAWNHGLRSGARSRPALIPIPDLPTGKHLLRAFWYQNRVWVFGSDVATYSWGVGELVWRVENAKPTPNGVAITQQSGPYFWAGKIHCPGGDGFAIDASREEIFDLSTRTWTIGPSWGAYSMLSGLSLYLPTVDRTLLLAGTAAEPRRVVGVNSSGTFDYSGNFIEFPSSGHPFLGVAIAFNDNPVLFGSSQGEIQRWNGASWPVHTAHIPFRPIFSTCTEVLVGEWLIAGGKQDGLVSGNQTVRFNPVTMVQTPTAPMIKKRQNHCAVIMADGNLLVVGGIDETGAYLDSAEIYDPVLDTWTLTTPRPVAAWRAGVVDIDGIPGIIGGDNAGGNLKNVNIFNPFTREWIHGLPDPNS